MEAWRQELYHHGIKGMRWGIRRFQNEDGSLTDEGRKRKIGIRRYLNPDSMSVNKKELEKSGLKDEEIKRKTSSLTAEGEKRKKYYDDVNSFAESRRKYNQNMREDIDSVVNAGRKGVDAGNEALKIYDRFANRNKKPIDLSQMSDKELQQRINRMNMEQQYQRLVGSNETSKGRQFAEDVLSVAGSALAIGSSALTIAMTIQQLRKG